MQRLTLEEARHSRALLWVVNEETGLAGPASLARPRWRRRYLVTRLGSYARGRQKEWVAPKDYGKTWYCCRLEV